MKFLSPGALRVPKYQRPVFMVAGGTSDFRKFYPEKKAEELVMEAFRMMLEENELKKDPLEIKGMINAAVYGHFADHFGDQLLGEAKVHDYLGLDPLPNIGLKTGGATGGYSMFCGANWVASGYADVVLVAGWERMDEVDTKTGNFYISTAACKEFETRLARIYSTYYSPMARRFAEKYNLSEITRAKVAVKNRLYGYYNPFAQQGGKHTVEEVLNGRMNAEPLRMLECCAMSVGASCMLLCSEEVAHKLTKKPVQLFVGGGSHTLRVADRRHMEIPLLPNETPETYAHFDNSENDPWPGFESFLAARFAAVKAYQMAGIQEPLKELDFVELHDAFTISDIQTYGDIGLRPYGQEPDYIESGDAYYGGKCPANLSGGLLGTMHAVGATGIYQGVETMWQIQKKYDKFHGDPKMWRRYGKKKPRDWKSLQVKNAKQGLWVSHAGVGSHVTVAVGRKAW